MKMDYKIPFLSDLYHHTQKNPSAMVLHNAPSGEVFSRQQLLRDISAFRDRLFSLLDARTTRSLHSRNEEVYIAIMLPLSYDFVVVFLSILSIGAIAVPLREYYFRALKDELWSNQLLTRDYDRSYYIIGN